MLRAGLLLIIRRYYSVYAANGVCHAFTLTGCRQDRNGIARNYHDERSTKHWKWI